uniref:Uncharacterized protein n=1 Tax=Timema cristinae TaxID=61476 RepID=A0A7R9DNG6_TIMCR|nr:unnamed protein product [Timema cristinae]
MSYSSDRPLFVPSAIFLRLLSSGKFKMLESIVILILLSGAFQHLSLAVDMDQEQLPQEKCKSMVR